MEVGTGCAGGAFVADFVGAAALCAVVLGAVVLGAVVFGAVVFGAVIFCAVVFGAVVLGAVVFGAAVLGALAPVAAVVVAVVVVAVVVAGLVVGVATLAAAASGLLDAPTGVVAETSAAGAAPVAPDAPTGDRVAPAMKCSPIAIRNIATGIRTQRDADRDIDVAGCCFMAWSSWVMSLWVMPLWVRCWPGRPGPRGYSTAGAGLMDQVRAPPAGPPARATAAAGPSPRMLVCASVLCHAAWYPTPPLERKRADRGS